MIQQVIFISYIRNPYRNSSSDDVMNQNLLYGFKQITKKLVLVALVEGEMEQDDIAEFYEDLYDEIIFCKGITKGTGTRWGALASMLLESHKKHYKDIPSELWKKCDSETTIIARIPYIDSALIANEIKKGVKDVNYVQYWGDPITLSLITPEQYSFKRFLHKLVEKKIQKKTDRIVYGTESLFRAEITAFPSIMDKAFPCDVSYCQDSADTSSNETKKDCLRIGYFGNYYSNIRNIKPLYEAVKVVDKVDLTICGSSDVDLEESANIHIMKRLPQSEASFMENGQDVVVCLLNSVGIQIPGKTFYQTNTHKPIVVILDGPYKAKIKEELEKSKRFIFCDNNIKSITDVMEGLLSGKYEIPWNTSLDYYNPKRICEDIIGRERVSEDGNNM